MGTMSEISALLDEIKSCGNTLISIYDELYSLIDRKEQDNEEKPKTTRRRKNKTEEPKTETAAAEEDSQETPEPVTLDEVRAALAERSRNGYTSDVKALIAKYGADKLSDVDPANYAALLKDAEVIGNA